MTVIEAHYHGGFSCRDVMCRLTSDEKLLEEGKVKKKEMGKGMLSVERRANMTAIAGHVIDVLGVKNPKYGESWKSKGGFSAFFNLDRKWSRVETLAAKYDYDIFAAIDATAGQPDGMIEALSDLMGYDMLILDDQCFVAEDPEHPEPGTAIVMKGISEAVDVSKEGLDANALRDGKIKCDGNHGG